MGNPIRNTAGELLTNGVALQIRDISTKVTKLQADRKRLSTFTVAAAVRVKNQYKYDIMTMPARPSTVTVVAVGTAGDVLKITVSAADLGWLQEGMNLRLDADTSPRITAIDRTSGTLQVTLDSTSGLAANNVLYLGAASSAEGSAPPTPFTRVPDVVTQYIGTIRCAWGITRMAASSANYSGIRQFETQLEAYDYLKDMLERSCIVDKKEEINGPPYQLKPGGAFYVATAAGNVYPFEDDVFSLAGMISATRHVSRWMPSQKLMWMVSPKGGEFLSQINMAKVIPVTKVEIPELGIEVDQYSFGNKKLQVHVIDQLDGGALEDEMLIIDPAGLASATTKNQKTGKRNWMLEESTITPGYDIAEGGVITCDFAPDYVPAFVWRLSGAKNYRA